MHNGAAWDTQGCSLDTAWVHGAAAWTRGAAAPFTRATCTYAHIRTHMHMHTCTHAHAHAHTCAHTHQERPPLLTCFVALQDVTAAMGPTHFMPGTHTAEVRPAAYPSPQAGCA